MDRTTVILACSSLKEYVEEAQRKSGTDLPVIYLNRIYHRDPNEMRENIMGKLSALPEGVDTVLVAMGYCGGSWEGVSAPCRIVLPRVDDCVSLLLQLGDEPVSDLKSPKHYYVRSMDPSKESIKAIFEHMAAGQDLDEETIEEYHRHWQDMYEEIDIMDTAINGARRPEYYSAVRADADWLDARVEYVRAGTYMIEKLITGEWDDQFLVVDPGCRVSERDMLIKDRACSFCSRSYLFL